MKSKRFSIVVSRLIGFSSCLVGEESFLCQLGVCLLVMGWLVSSLNHKSKSRGSKFEFSNGFLKLSSNSGQSSKFRTLGIQNPRLVCWMFNIRAHSINLQSKVHQDFHHFTIKSYLLNFFLLIHSSHAVSINFLPSFKDDFKQFFNLFSSSSFVHVWRKWWLRVFRIIYNFWDPISHTKFFILFEKSYVKVGRGEWGSNSFDLRFPWSGPHYSALLSDTLYISLFQNF